MSVNSLGQMKKAKNNPQPTRFSENQLFSVRNNSLPKKVDYSKVIESKNEIIYPSENVVLNLATNLNEE
jgi:hypothetical protein